MRLKKRGTRRTNTRANSLPLMTLRLKARCESAFCGICEPSRRCWPGQPSSMPHETCRSRSTLSRLVRRTRTLGVLACVPHGTYHRERDLHPAFQEVIRRLYLLPTKLSMTAIAEHADLKRTARRLQEDTGTAVPLPTYEQVRGYVDVLKQEPQVRQSREQVPGPLRDRQSPRSFARSIPAPAQLAQVDEHSMELYVITPDGIPVTRRVHAAVLVCVKTAAIMSAVLALGPRKRRRLHATHQGGIGTQGSSGPPGRVSASLALFRQASGRLS